MYSKSCHTCGRPYASNRPLSKFCSDECRQIGRTEYNTSYVRLMRAAQQKKSPRQGRCLHCCKAFDINPRGGYRKYCGSECMKAAHKKPVRLIVCAQCDKEFLNETMKGNRRFCCTACRKLYHSRKQNEKAKALRASLRFSAQWISVDDQLPEPRTPVLVATEPGNVGVAFRIQERVKELDRWCGSYEAYITHWMPLPKPPIMKGDGQ